MPCVHSLTHFSEQTRKIIWIVKHSAVEYDLAGVYQIDNRFQCVSQGFDRSVYQQPDSFISAECSFHDIVDIQLLSSFFCAEFPENRSFVRRQDSKGILPDSSGGSNCLKAAAFSAGARFAAACNDRYMPDLRALLADTVPDFPFNGKGSAYAVFTA